MKQEELDIIKEEYIRLNHLRTIASLLKEEKEELEQEQMVKRYNEVCAKLKKMSMYLNFSDHYIMSTALEQVNITNTNNIFVCLGTYKHNKDTNGINEPLYTITNHDDEEAVYSEYVDLEKDISECFQINIKLREQFEKINNIIYINPFDRTEFYKVQNDFFKNVIENGQEKTVDTIKKQLTK